MRAGIGVLVCVLLGCGSEPKPRAGGTAPPPAAVSTASLDEAVGFERGTRGVRDYAKAAAIYRQLCRDGAGDLGACRKLLWAIINGRGIDADRARAAQVAAGMCKHDRALGCLMSVLLRAESSRSSDDPSAHEEAVLSQIRPHCEAGDANACEAALIGSSLSFSGGSSAERLQHSYASTACKAGIMIACISLVEEMTRCAHDARVKECVDYEIAEWKQNGRDDAIEALAALGVACDIGDAEACAAIPGREIALATLCTAHDYESCAKLGCQGDKDAEKRARDHFAEADCERETKLEKNRRAQERRAALPSLVAEPPRPPIRPAKRKPFESVVFRQLAERNDMDWPRFEVYNLGTKTIVSIGIVSYAYDRAGRQAGRSAGAGVMFAYQLKPGQSTVMDLAGGSRSAPPPPVDTAASYELCVDSIMFEGDTDDTQDPKQCPEQRPKRK